MVTAAKTANIICHSSQRSPAGNIPSATNRRSRATAATLDPIAKYAVIGNGAPSYVSGAHIWNGTTASLNPNPTTINATPAHKDGIVSPKSVNAILIEAKCVTPNVLYIKLIP